MTIRIGVDTGGTFTDLVAIDDTIHETMVVKKPSTPSEPSKAVFDALESLSRSLNHASALVLGTTLATNALLTRRGARVLFITTSGFEDIPHLQRADKKDPYNLQAVRPAPLVARADCLGVSERVDHLGRIVQPLTDSALDAVGDRVEVRLRYGDGRPTAIAVSLLFAFANPDHEKRLGGYLRRRFPEVPITLSHHVAPVWREYERGSTAIIDAYVRPLMTAFVEELSRGLERRGLRIAFAVMKSNGGQMLADAAADTPVETVLSGLAGGVIAGKFFGAQCGRSNVISFDMGGTSTDVGVVKDGHIGYRNQYDLEFFLPVATSVIDLITIGAGGGSIAWIDKGGLLKVGPQSAGADPGPVCYGRGGTDPTVTDANLVLGRLDAGFFLGGEMPLDIAQATAAIGRLGDRIGLSVKDAAQAIVEVANENMANAIRVLTIERGLDPREFSLVAFGGAGPLHASEVAAALGISEIIIPPHPGLASAFGTLLADRRVDKRWTRLFRSTNADCAAIQFHLDDLVHAASGELTRQGFTGTPILQRTVSMRYAGQNSELDVPVPEGPITPDVLARLHEMFQDQHEASFGYKIPGEVIELVHFNVAVIGPTPPPALAIRRGGEMPAPQATRAVYFKGHGSVQTPIYSQHTLPAGAVVTGPAVIEETDSTILVHHGQRLTVREDGLMQLTTPTAQPETGPAKLDGVTLVIIHNHMVNTCREMASAMVRTAYSPIFSEARDFSCAVFDPDGNMLAQGEGCPSQIGAIRHTVKWTIAELGPEGFDPGDVIIHNDPYRGGCHMPEHMVLKPVFYRGTLLAFVANIAHIAEIGGLAPGSFASNATEVYQEGLRLPPIKLMRRGEHVRDVWKVVLANHRTPRNTWGDFHAMLGSLNVAERRVIELADKYGPDVVRRAGVELIRHAERWMKEELRRIPEGEYVFEDEMEDDGVVDQPVRFRVRVTIRNGEAIVDFTGSDRQARGPINATYGVTSAAACNAFLQVTDSTIPRNDGVYRPIKIIAPPGSVVNVQHPGPSVGGNTETQPKMVLLILGALAHAIPERVSASEGITSCNFLFGGVHPETHQYYANYHFEASGWGGRYRTDGNDAQNHIHGNCRITPVEVFEVRFPWHTISYGLIPDSGGPGRRRGGLGTRRILEARASEIRLSVFMDHVKTGAWGFNGGGDGRTAGVYIKRRGDDRFRSFTEAFGTVSPSKFANILISAGDQVMIESAGGAGYGSPEQREPDLVLRDVGEGFVSEQAARAQYQVAIRHENGRLVIDEHETARMGGRQHP
jgi:N-methylhydantoinase A/oxoprolinase/acetone carboxylase beta subunit/N-methylhydantoinase B/oxoprolinase/acetone carboxylase alpha subunit